MNDFLINSSISILIVNVVLFIASRHIKIKANKIFTLYLIITLLIQLVSNIMMRYKIDNLFLSHFYFIGQFILLSIFYIDILKEDVQRKIVKWGLFAGLSCLAIQYALQPLQFFKFNLFEIFITSFLLIVYATFHLYNLLNEKKQFYYINLGILIYLSGSTILFLVGNLTAILSPELNKTTWILNSVLYIIYQSLIFIEWKVRFSNLNTLDEL